MEVFILAFILVAVAIGGIAIKMFVLPGGTFTKTCGSTFDPKTGERKPCACATGQPEDCHNSEENKSSDLIINLKKSE